MVQRSEPVPIRPYGNQRPYRPDVGAYVTVGDLAAIARGGAATVVRDARNQADVTQFIFAQDTTEQ